MPLIEGCICKRKFHLRLLVYINCLSIVIFQPCPPASKDFRTLQCESFNGIKYRGGKHEWVPVISDGK